MDILVVLENNQGSLHRLSKEAIVGAQMLGDSVSAIVMGGGSGDIAVQLEGYDLEKVIIVDHELVRSYNADGYSEVLKQVIESASPKMIKAKMIPYTGSRFVVSITV